MKITGREPLWQGDFLKTVRIAYLDNKGVARTWEAVDRVGADGVVIIVPVTGAGELILIRQFRVVIGNYAIEFPAGLINPGEDLMDAARRELIEETGFDGRDFSVLVENVISTGSNAERWTAVLARGALQVPEEIRAGFPGDESEDIEVIRTPAAALADFLFSSQKAGDSVDLRVYGLFETAKRKKLI
ncbi:MAG: NUDIX hydrolase [Nitrospiraceae bacterium]|nr:NUDIX hydrolase [Nitrospiraceae bacterium]